MVRTAGIVVAGMNGGERLGVWGTGSRVCGENQNPVVVVEGQEGSRTDLEDRQWCVQVAGVWRKKQVVTPTPCGMVWWW